MSNHFSKRLEKSFMIGMDLSFILTGYYLTAWFVPYPIARLEANSSVFLTLTLIGLLTFYMFDLYGSWKRKSSTNLVCSIFLALALFTVTSFFIGLLLSWTSTVHLVLFASFFQFIFIVTARLAMWHLARFRHGMKNVLVVSKSNMDGHTIAEKFHHHHKGWFQVMDIVTTQHRGSIKKYLKQADVVILSSEVERSMQSSVTNLCIRYGKEVLIVPRMFDFALKEAEIQQVNDMMVFSIPSNNFNGIHQVVKRTMDIVISMVLLIVLSPVMIALYFLIPLTSKGPAFFKQERVGLNEKPFQIVKFRSMVEDAEKNTGPVLALEKDPRITTIGRVLRAIRFDELPQLLNVIKGEMSLIGPRPERPFFVKQFKKEVPDYMKRFDVKPGITGLAQISANYGTSVEEKLRYDLMYVRSCSFTIDIRILMQTIRVVLQRDQAKGVMNAEVERKTNYRGITIAKHN
ncbi:sugar transferase [Bacillus sp. RO1]|uniref:sugar transferase n=1 Tax=Bacillus sp. RO1 TaxID=2722703 RepID=UPI001456A350|nr:sugar transferase [Bacillus sp. RO1]NLP51078.1 sugar transferase [Bacillus sp. RO1]